MEEKLPKKTDIAVIFKKSGHPEKTIYYKPIDIEIGYLDKNTNQFITKNGGSYHYLIDTEYKYGFGLRMSLDEFKKTFQINNITLKEAANYYLSELKRYRYYFGVQDTNNFSDLNLIAEEKVSKQTCIALDPDLNIAINMILNSSQQPHQKTVSTEPVKLTFDAKKLSDELKKVIIGQDSPIDDIVTIIWQNLRSNTKNNILLIGPSGVGKTEIIRNITKKLNIPMASINITDMSQSAYAGPSISEAIRKLVKNANNDITKASNGIIFIDEIDKKAGFGDYNTGVVTTGVQDELLKLLEDNDYEVNISDNPYAPQYANINTKNITFICAGAFSEMDKIRKESNKKSMGFTSSSEEQKSKITSHITSEDLVKYGLKTELVGRLHNIIELSPLTKEDLIKIMKNPNNKTIQEKINILNSEGIKLNLDEEVYEFLAADAIKRKTGARGLVSSVDKLFIKAMTEISQSTDNYEELIINKDTIQDHHAYTLVKRKK